MWTCGTCDKYEVCLHINQRADKIMWGVESLYMKQPLFQDTSFGSHGDADTPRASGLLSAGMIICGCELTQEMGHASIICRTPAPNSQTQIDFPPVMVALPCMHLTILRRPRSSPPCHPTTGCQSKAQLPYRHLLPPPIPGSRIHTPPMDASSTCLSLPPAHAPTLVFESIEIKPFFPWKLLSAS